MDVDNAQTPFVTNPLGEGLNLYRSGGWRGQLARIRRWHARLRACRPDDYLDFLYAFIQNSSHLAEWIVKDEPDAAARVRQTLNDVVELSICRDISNATKHFRLDRQPRVTAGFADGREYLPEGWPTEHPARFPVFVIAAGRKYDALELADRCLAAWEQLAAEIDSARAPELSV